MAVYEDLPGVRISSLSHMATSAFEYQFYEKNPEAFKETAAMWLGTAFHCDALEPERFPEAYKLFKGAKLTKAVKEQYKADGYLPIKKKDLDTVKAMTASVKAHPLASNLLNSETLKTEHVIQWKFEEKKCKGKLDGIDIEAGIVFDLKKTNSAEMNKFSWQCRDLHYHEKAAWYLHGAKQVYGKDFEWFWIAAESTPPYSCAVYGASLDHLEEANQEWKRWFYMLLKCEETGEWPGLNNDQLEYV